MLKHKNIKLSSSGKNQPTLVVVLGMHRSGTSVITNILSKAGFYTGEHSELIKKDRWNSNGYFERWEVVKLNELILKLLKGSWQHPPEENDLINFKIVSKIQSLLKVYKGHKLAIIKDPRLCLTFPVWQGALGDNMRILIITREPEAVAASLYQRDRLSVEESFHLWKTYNERALKYSKGYPVFPMRYEDLFLNVRSGILNKLALFLGIDTDLEKIASHTVEPSLRHYGMRHHELIPVSKIKPDIHTGGPAEQNLISRLIDKNKIYKGVKSFNKFSDIHPEHEFLNDNPAFLNSKDKTQQDAQDTVK